MNDPTPEADAYAALVDRLLASPRYAERQARHWLDLVRYSESDGYRQDADRPHVWRYRDYVVAAFHADEPYDQFLREQRAGDQINPDDPELRVATTFLRLYPYEFNIRSYELAFRTQAEAPEAVDLGNETEETNPKRGMAATTTPTASPCGWPGAACRAVRWSARPTKSACTPSRTGSTSTTSTRPSCGSWVLTTPS